MSETPATTSEVARQYIREHSDLTIREDLIEADRAYQDALAAVAEARAYFRSLVVRARDDAGMTNKAIAELFPSPKPDRDCITEASVSNHYRAGKSAVRDLVDHRGNVVRTQTRPEKTRRKVEAPFDTFAEMEADANREGRVNNELAAALFEADVDPMLHDLDVADTAITAELVARYGADA